MATVFTKVVLPNTASRDDNFKKLLEKSKKLGEDAAKVDEGGELFIFFASRGNKYTPVTQVISSLMSLDSLYRQRELQRKPELIAEYGEIMTLVDQLDKKLKKRKRQIKKEIEARRKASNEQDKKEEVKNESN